MIASSKWDVNVIDCPKGKEPDENHFNKTVLNLFELTYHSFLILPS